MRAREYLISINNHTPALPVSVCMAALLFTCPVTGYRVQGWVAEPVDPAGESAPFASVKCLACQQVHIIDLILNPPNLPDGTPGPD